MEKFSEKCPLLAVFPSISSNTDVVDAFERVHCSDVGNQDDKEQTIRRLIGAGEDKYKKLAMGPWI